MRILIVMTLFCLMACATAADTITTDPNAGQATESDLSSAADNAPAAKRVSIEARKKTVSAILTELSGKTGITLKAGTNERDWQVRDRKMTIYCRDLPLSNLMNSIARVMKFKWAKEHAKDGSVFYRLHQERKARLGEELLRSQAKDADTQRRHKALELFKDLMSVSPEQLEKLKTDSPFEYALAISGVAKSFGGFLAEAPGVHQTLAAGESLDIPAKSFSPEALIGLARTSEKMPELDMLSSSRPGPFDADQLLRDRDQMVIHINPDPDRTRLLAMRFLGDITVSGGSQKGLRLDILDPDGKMAQLSGRIHAGMLMEPKPPEKADAVKVHDDPGLHSRVKISAESKELPDVQFALAMASGRAVVSDSYGRLYGNVHNDTEMELGQLLDRIGESFDYDWRKHGPILEFTDRKWFSKRLDDIPEAWMQKWRTTLKKTGTLGLEDIGDIAALTQEQYRANVMTDDVFRACSGFTRDFIHGSHTSRFVGCLSKAQRAAILTKQGLDLRTLTPQQWAGLDRLCKEHPGCSLKPDGSLMLTGSRVDRPGQWGYKLLVSGSGISKAMEMFVWAPKYMPPDPGKAADQPLASK